MMFSQSSFTPLCPKCGVQHFSHQSCAYTFNPDAALMVTGEDSSEDASIVRYDALRSLGEAATLGFRKAESMGRLEASLRLLDPS